MSDSVPVILVVDADPETHLASESAFPDTECVVMGARTAEMGLKMAERRPPAVLVVDARLGGIAYLTERLRRISAHLHIVHLVGPDHVVDPSQRLAGGTSLLRKPFEPSRFRSTLRTVLRLSAMSAGVKRMHEGSSPPPRRASWLGEAPPPASPRPAPDGEPRPSPVPRAGRESELPGHRPLAGRVMRQRHESGIQPTPTPVPERESEAPRFTPVPRSPRAK